MNKSNIYSSGIDDSTMYIFIIRYASLSGAYIGIHMCIKINIKIFLATLVRTMCNLL